MLIKTLTLAAVLVSGLTASVNAQIAAPTQPENTGPNTNIKRWAEGTYTYQMLSDKRQRAWEKFRMNVHPDGSRTMIMWHDLYARNNQFTVVLRVAENFRPLEAYLSYWTPNGYKGSNFITVMGDKLSAMSNGPTGQLTQALNVPEKLSIGSHPVAADGWHTWYEDPKVKGPQKGTLYSMDATADINKPPLGTLVPFEFERVGKEKVTTPAGTFDAVKYKLGGASEAWITEQDKLMIRVVNGPRDLEYLLTEFKSGDNAKK